MMGSETTAHHAGEPLLLIPGQLCTGELWDATVASLTRETPVQVAESPGAGDFGGVGGGADRFAVACDWRAPRSACAGAR
jgi:hypothetical protein